MFGREKKNYDNHLRGYIFLCLSSYFSNFRSLKIKSLVPRTSILRDLTVHAMHWIKYWGGVWCIKKVLKMYKSLQAIFFIWQYYIFVKKLENKIL